jgi:hypothetical protein
MMATTALRTLFLTVLIGRLSIVDAYSPDNHAHAIKIMRESPLIDTHIDLPQIIRSLSTLISSLSPSPP